MANPNRTIHRKKFDGGRRTAQQFHEEHAFPPGAACANCGKRPSVRAIVMAPFDEVQKRGMLPQGALINPSIMQAIVPIKDAQGLPTPYVRLSIAYACRTCQPAFERALAKAPSWCIVEINRGPNPTERVQVGYG